MAAPRGRCDATGMIKALNRFLDAEMRRDRVGHRVAAMRETLALSKAQLADSLGLDRSSLSKIERGAAGLDIATGVQIANLYGFGLDYIYRGQLSDVPLDLLPRLQMNLQVDWTRKTQDTDL